MILADSVGGVKSTVSGVFEDLKFKISEGYTQYGPIKNGRIKNQGSDFEKK